MGVTTTPVMVRTSERKLFTQCRQHWYWAYVKQWGPKERRFGPLIFGDLTHRALAEYYQPEVHRKLHKPAVRGPHPADTFAKLFDVMAAASRTREFKVYVDDDDEDIMDARALGIEMLTNYIDLYGDDRRWLIVYPEMPFQMELKDGNGVVVAIYVGTTDGLAYDLETGRYIILEHKTARVIDTRHLFLDEQANTYWALIPLWLRQNGVIGPDVDIDAMEYNFLRKAGKPTKPTDADGRVLNKPLKEALAKKLQQLTKEPPPKGWKVEDLEEELRKHGVQPELLGEPSKNQPAPLFHRELVFRGEAERFNTYDRILAQIHEMNMVRSGELEVYKAPGDHCKWCEFRDVCELHEQGSNWKQLVKLTMKKWEPYTDHVWSLRLAGASATK